MKIKHFEQYSLMQNMLLGSGIGLALSFVFIVGVLAIGEEVIAGATALRDFVFPASYDSEAAAALQESRTSLDTGVSSSQANVASAGTFSSRAGGAFFSLLFAAFLGVATRGFLLRNQRRTFGQ